MFDYKKIRPRRFEQVVGNINTIELIKSALDNEFPSFSILIGQEGIGKTTLSKIIAMSLTCRNRINGLACEECDNCKNSLKTVVLENKDTDNILTFTMSDEGGKIAARKIQEQINIPPIGGGIKVIILEECQGMLYPAQDLLLPTLEYLPPHVKIIACTTNERALQKTFLSRASTFYLRVPSKKETFILLDGICKAYEIKVSSHSLLFKIIEHSEGKPRESLSTLKKLAMDKNGINTLTVNSMLNILDENLYLEYLEILRGDMGLVLDFVEKLNYNEVSVLSFVKGLNKFIVKIITFKYRETFLPESVIPRTKALIESIDPKDLLKIQSIIAEESLKFTDEETSVPLLMSMSFKIMNRNHHKELISETKSKSQVMQEKEKALSEQIKRAREKEAEEKKGSMDLGGNISALLEGVEAKIIGKVE